MGTRIKYLPPIVLCAAAALAFLFTGSTAVQAPLMAAQLAKTQDTPAIPVRYTDVREAAKITFQQDSTQTEEKYYLETMGTGVAWIDYDQDGLMDLFFVQSAATDIYKPPYPLRCALYHNNGDGTFSDVTGKAGVGGEGHYGQGVAAADFDNDGWPDIAIANDSWPNFLFINKRNGTFEDVSLASGVAASEDGRYEAGMGIDAADVDSDGWQDIYVTHLDHELNRLYHNNRDGTFTDATYTSGIGNKALLLSGVSMKFLDYDNDGWNDILQLNGAMLDNVQLYHSEVTYPEPLLMFRNSGKGQFAKVSNQLGPDFVRPIVGRAIATADYDNDGDLDIATNNRGDYPSVLRNYGRNANNWITV